MPSRREVLIGGAAVLAGCDPIVSTASRLLGADLPGALVPHAGPSVRPARRLLNRAAYGPWPGDEARVEAMGREAWVDEQLDPESIDDAAGDVRAELVDVANVPSDLVFELRPEHVERQLVTHTLLRAVYSRRQLREVMVGFWADHLNVHMGKSLCRHLTATYVRDVLRPRALGRFRDLLGAVVASPAMLVYLDGRENRRGVPNENYARELLELHALGVHGGYAQRDVMEAARCLTGWTVAERGAPGSVAFDPARHDDGEKVVLGQRIAAGGGARDLDRLLDVVVAHPSCARFVSEKLCRFFVADAPPPGVREAAHAAFVASDGEIGATVRAILLHPDLYAAPPRVSRPFPYVVRALRALGADTHARGALRDHLARMGQLPFDHPTPDGYPFEEAAWLGTMLPRWRFALALAEGHLDDTAIDLPRLRDALPAADPLGALFRHLVGRDPTPEERTHALSHPPARALALVLSSPAYVRC
ncbi:MAG: DUF1800 domain-containing protein [Sandaracinaceae bacterium]